MRLESDTEVEMDLLGIPGVHRVRIVSAPRIVCQAGEEARIESGVQLDGGDRRPGFVADVRFEPAGGDLYLIEVTVERRGETLRGEFRMGAGESILISQASRGSLLAAVITFRPLVKPAR